MRHDDFTHSHPHLSQLYSGTDLAARLTYEELLRQASLAYQASLSESPVRSRTRVVTRVGGLLVRWGEQLQAGSAAMASPRSLDTRAR